jgi:tetratricopeptide (TPR) repeat protein
MGDFRRLLGGLFGILSVGLLVIVISASYSTMHGPPLPEALRRLQVVFAVQAVVFGLACWKILRRRPAARWWGLGAGVVWVLGDLFTTFTGSQHQIRVPWVTLLCGIAAIVVFAKRDPVADSAQGKLDALKKRPRISGDGTSAILDQAPLLCWFIGFTLGMRWWYPWAHAHGLPPVIGWFWPNLIAAELITTFIHECGHAITARVLGIGVRGFVAGPFQWHAGTSGWQFRFRPMGFFSGEGATRFDMLDPALVRWRAICMIAAGPFANLLLGLAALFATLQAPGTSWQAAWGLLSILATLSLIASAINLIPARTADAYTDGANLYQLLSGRPWVEFRVDGELMQRKTGLDLLVAGKPEEAETYFRKALEQESTLPQANRVRLLVCLADALQDQDRYQEAQGYLETALALGDETGSGYGSMADILLLQGNDPKRAIAMAEEAARLNLERIRKDRGDRLAEAMAQVRLLARQAQARAQMGQRVEAEDAMQDAVRMLDPELKEPERGSPNAAEVVFGRAPNEFANLLKAYSCWLVGRALAAMNQDREAAQYFRKSCELDAKGKFRRMAERMRMPVTQ